MNQKYFIVCVNADDDNDPPTHCAMQLRGDALLAILWRMIIAWTVKKVVKDLSDIRFEVAPLRWLMHMMDAAALIDVVAEGDIASAFYDVSHLIGDQVEIMSFGYFRFWSFHEYDNARFYSDELYLPKLARVLIVDAIHTARKATIHFLEATTASLRKWDTTNP